MVSEVTDNKIHRIINDVIHRGFSEEFDVEIEWFNEYYPHISVHYNPYDNAHIRLVKTSYSKFHILNHLIPRFELEYVPVGRISYRRNLKLKRLLGDEWHIIVGSHEFPIPHVYPLT